MLVKIFILSLAFCLSAGRRVPFYRKDYTYFDEFDAFYKLHSDAKGASWSSAFFACEKESAQLFYPKAHEEWKIVKSLMESKGLAIENFTDIYVGIKNEGIDEFITIDGLSTPSPLLNDGNLKSGELCTTMDVENGSLNVDLCTSMEDFPKPYVCKKVEDVSCPTIDKGYNYVKDTKKCYKVNQMSHTWHDALNTCVMEGGLLANFESEMEASIPILLQLTNDNNLYHVGFRKISPSGEYYNMKGQNIKDAYEKYYNNGEEKLDCGTIWNYSNMLYLKTVACSELRPFICEIEVNK